MSGSQSTHSIMPLSAIYPLGVVDVFLGRLGLGGEVRACLEAHEPPPEPPEHAVGDGREGRCAGSGVEAVLGVEVEGVEQVVELVVPFLANQLQLLQGQARGHVAVEVDKARHAVALAKGVGHAVVHEGELVREQPQHTDVVGRAGRAPLESDDVLQVRHALHEAAGNLEDRGRRWPQKLL